MEVIIKLKYCLLGVKQQSLTHWIEVIKMKYVKQLWSIIPPISTKQNKQSKNRYNYAYDIHRVSE
jgi:hypothetical protein